MSSLTYKKDFWDFYKTNSKDLDRMLWKIVWNYKSVMDPEELKNEVLVRLHSSDFLNSFNPERSEIGTFFTQRAFGYARHVVTAEIKHNRRHHTSPVSATDNDEKTYPGQTVTSVVVPTHSGEEEKVDSIILWYGLNQNADVVDIDRNEDLNIQMAWEKAVAKLGASYRTIVEMKIEGYTNKEIAAELGCSVTYVTVRLDKIKACLSSELNK